MPHYQFKILHISQAQILFRNSHLCVYQYVYIEHEIKNVLQFLQCYTYFLPNVIDK